MKKHHFAILLTCISLLTISCTENTQRNTIGFGISPTCQTQVKAALAHNDPKLTVKYHPINNKDGGFHSPFIEYAQLSSKHYTHDELLAYMNGALSKCGLDKKVTFAAEDSTIYNQLAPFHAEQPLYIKMQNGEMTIYLNSQ